MSDIAIETERLLLRAPTIEDAPLFLRYVVENREHLSRWEPLRDEAYYTLDHWSVTLASQCARIRRGDRFSRILFSRETVEGNSGSEPEILGSCTLDPIQRGAFLSATLGYSLAAHATGNGLMQEALTALIAHAFGSLGLHRIEEKGIELWKNYQKFRLLL